MSDLLVGQLFDLRLEKLLLAEQFEEHVLATWDQDAIAVHSELQLQDWLRAGLRRVRLALRHIIRVVKRLIALRLHQHFWDKLALELFAFVNHIEQLGNTWECETLCFRWFLLICLLIITIYHAPHCWGIRLFVPVIGQLVKYILNFFQVCFQLLIGALWPQTSSLLDCSFGLTVSGPHFQNPTTDRALTNLAPVVIERGLLNTTTDDVTLMNHFFHFSIRLWVCLVHFFVVLAKWLSRGDLRHHHIDFWVLDSTNLFVAYIALKDWIVARILI